MTTDTMPGDAEAAGAIAALADLHGWSPRPGDAVRVPRAFGGGYQDGVVFGRDPNVNSHRSRDIWLIDTPEGRLTLYLEELERI